MHPVRWTCCAAALAGIACSRDADPGLRRHMDPAVASTASNSPAAEHAPEPEPGPLVSLDGSSRALSVAVVDAGNPRVYSRAPRTWIHEKPSRESRRLGYLRAGASSPTSRQPAGTEGCKQGWYPVAPTGYVCVGRRATLNSEDPVVAVTEEHPPDHLRKLPYIYGTVRNPGPIYARLPKDGEARAEEGGFEARMQRWLDAGGEIGASYAQHVWLSGPGDPPDPRRAWQDQVTDPVAALLPSPLPNLRRRPRNPDQLVIGHMRPRAGLALLHTFFWHGRRYGVTAELEIVPTDRLRPIQGSDFHGFRIGADVEFPFAIVRQPGAKYYAFRQSSGRLVVTGKAPYRAAVPLTGKQNFFDGRLHYETLDGQWLSDQDASRLEPAKKMPGWGKRGEKWIDINLTKQTLMLYEGTRPVYATLISSGEAGLEDAEHTTATKRGIFRVHTKHFTATMSSSEVGEEFELRDVPYVQYFDKEGYALHGAYWHDRFGIPKSHGCINLAPEDARRLFYWTEPRLPRGWHGVLKPLTGTVLFIHP